MRLNGEGGRERVKKRRRVVSGSNDQAIMWVALSYFSF
ncbi:MAG: hypothetical protein ACJAY8_000651, partial [Sphingobacteriales bacterium]